MTLPELPPLPPSASWAPCPTCSAVVEDTQEHAAWHAQIEERLAALEQALP